MDQDIKAILAEVAARAEEEDDGVERPLYRSRNKPKPPPRPYSVRPVDVGHLVSALRKARDQAFGQDA